jgi:hypothetical protein
MNLFAAIMIGLALGLSIVALLVARNSYRRVRRLMDRVIGRLNAPRCAEPIVIDRSAGPESLVRCALHEGHHRGHLVDPSELGNLVRPPF